MTSHDVKICSQPPSHQATQPPSHPATHQATQPPTKVVMVVVVVVVGCCTIPHPSLVKGPQCATKCGTFDMCATSATYVAQNVAQF